MFGKGKQMQCDGSPHAVTAHSNLYAARLGRHHGAEILIIGRTLLIGLGLVAATVLQYWSGSTPLSAGSMSPD